MLILSRIPSGVEPLISRWHMRMWIQMHDLPPGFMSKGTWKHLGDFIGEFLAYDAKDNSSIWMKYMRIKIRLDVRRPL